MWNVLFQLTTEKTDSDPVAKKKDQISVDREPKSNFTFQLSAKKNRKKAERTSPVKPGTQHIKTSSLFNCNPTIPALKV